MARKNNLRSIKIKLLQQLNEFAVQHDGLDIFWGTLIGGEESDDDMVNRLFIGIVESAPGSKFADACLIACLQSGYAASNPYIYLLADALYEAQDFTNARKFYEAYLNQNLSLTVEGEDFTHSLLNLAKSYEETGEKASAYEAFRLAQTHLAQDEYSARKPFNTATKGMARTQGAEGGLTPTVQKLARKIK